MFKICLLLGALCTISSTLPVKNDTVNIPPPDKTTATPTPTAISTSQQPTTLPSSTTMNSTITTMTTTMTTTLTTLKPTKKTTTVEPGSTTSTQKPISTTETPGPTKAPVVITTAVPDSADTSRHFDGLSFMGGIILTVGATGLATLGYKIYRIRTERTYHNF